MIQIIPAIDIINGRCVRLQQGNFNSVTNYNSDPVDMARRFEDHGIKRLHLVDLDGARAKRIINHAILEKIAGQTNLTIDFGGGLRSDNDVKAAFESGADMVTGGSIAVKERELFLGWLDRYGSEKVLLGADFKDGMIAVSGWQERTEHDLYQFLSGYFETGIRIAVCTDISKDGMLEGASVETYRKIKKEISELELVASGGISEMNDIELLAEERIDGVIIGKAIYEGRISLTDLEKYIIENA